MRVTAWTVHDGPGRLPEPPSAWWGRALCIGWLALAAPLLTMGCDTIGSVDYPSWVEPVGALWSLTVPFALGALIRQRIPAFGISAGFAAVAFALCTFDLAGSVAWGTVELVVFGSLSVGSLVAWSRFRTWHRRTRALWTDCHDRAAARSEADAAPIPVSVQGRGAERVPCARQADLG